MPVYPSRMQEMTSFDKSRKALTSPLKAPHTRSKAPDDSLNAMLRTSHRLTLGVLVLCALLTALQSEGDASVRPPMVFSLAAVGAALIAIICRRLSTSVKIQPSTRAGLAMTGLACAGLIGATGVLLVWTLGDRQSALLFNAGAVILSLRPPVSVTPAQ